ncbi:MAG TPA: hypothetical protein VMV92_22885 [Streptosporangiaceae bacterium]|nr:hypothetical protein [Streptosporangiaceae bacterium]
MPRAPESKGRRHLPVGAATPLAGVIVSNLVNAHGTGQWVTDLAALTLILGHEVLIHVLALPRHQPPGSSVCDDARGEPAHQGYWPRDRADH